ncbi:MAG: hypothetical protein ACREKG_10095, partial [Candidatus Rokuibacteriota bacterium]
MDNSADPGGRPDARNPLSKWVDEMQGVIGMITNLIDESDRHRAAAESAQREQGAVREDLSRVRAEME